MPCHSRFDTPLGEMIAVVNDAGALVRLDFADVDQLLEEEAEFGVRDDDRLAEVRKQLEEYFSGQRREFELEVDPEGTEFQREVWSELRNIPYGTTITYGEQARRIDRTSASRAVGAANGQNPIAIVIPCHRVIGADGSLTGYAGGIERKRKLLELEGVLSSTLAL